MASLSGPQLLRLQQCVLRAFGWGRRRRLGCLGFLRAAIVHQKKYQFRSSCTYRDFTVYFVYSDSNVSDGYYDWVVDSYRALRAALMLTMHTTLTRVVT